MSDPDSQKFGKILNGLKKEIYDATVTDLGVRHYKEDVEHRFDARNREYFWICGDLENATHIPGTDCHAVENGKISINSLKLLPSFDEEKVKWSGIVSNS